VASLALLSFFVRLCVRILVSSFEPFVFDHSLLPPSLFLTWYWRFLFKAYRGYNGRNITSSNIAEASHSQTKAAWSREGTRASRQSAVELSDVVDTVSAAYQHRFLKNVAKAISSTAAFMLLWKAHPLNAAVLGKATGYVYSSLTKFAQEKVMEQVLLAFSSSPFACNYQASVVMLTETPASGDILEFAIFRGTKERRIRLLVQPTSQIPPGECNFCT
jgi:hypothetical protein